ncbi:MAG: histidinol dehydrogenase [Thermomicrobiales bacterium]
MIDIAFITDLETARHKLTRTGGFAEPELPEYIVQRNRDIFGETLSASEVVARTIAEVRRDGDAALNRFGLAYDRRPAGPLEVPRAAIEAAWSATDPGLQRAMEVTTDRVRTFHQHQPSQSWIEPEELGIFGQIVRPLNRVGIYAPAGSAPLPSSLLMIAIPARVAGVDDIIVCSPAGPDGSCHQIVLAAAYIAGVDRVFTVGGAAAIAAMAYGTETIPAVDKIVGPGNLFTTLAKKQVYGDVDIDQLAGPTETMVVADAGANAELVAADMLAQAEHGETSSAILITTSPTLAAKVQEELGTQLEYLQRGSVAEEALRRNGAIIVVDSPGTAIELANAYSPEHLCLLTNDPWSLIPSIKNAAGIFVGEQSPEAIGDYTAGPSHVMPTGGSARYASPVNIRDYQKVISIIAANDRAVAELGPATITFANAEGLTAHAAAIERRLKPTDK